MFINQRYTRNKMYHINYTLTLQIKLSDKEKKIGNFSKPILKKIIEISLAYSNQTTEP